MTTTRADDFMCFYRNRLRVGQPTPEQFIRFLPDRTVRALRILGIALKRVYGYENQLS